MAAELLLIAPLVLVGALLVAAGLAVWTQGPRSPLVIAFSVLLVFNGDLHLIRALFSLPDTPAAAVRLWPLFDVVVSACALAFLILFFQNRLNGRTMDAWLSSLIGGATLVAVLVVVMPELYWGNKNSGGPLGFVDGIRTTAFATIGWMLLRDPTMRRGPVISALAVAFLLAPVFWVTTDLLYVRVLHADLPNLSADPAHWGRLFALIPVGAAFFDLARRALGKSPRADREAAKRMLLLVLFPALSSVILLDALVLGLIAPDAADLILAGYLGPVWTLAIPAVVGMAILQAPAQLGGALLDAARGLLRDRDHTPSPVAVDWD